VGEGRVRGIRKGLLAYLFLLTPTLSIRRGNKFSAIFDALNSYKKGRKISSLFSF
jgi:hypothetical protein